MTDTLWKIVELGTNGWYVIDPKVDQNLTKEQAERRLEHYIGEGYSPQRLKAKHQNDNRIDKQVMAVRKMSKNGSPVGEIRKKLDKDRVVILNSLQLVEITKENPTEDKVNGRFRSNKGTT